MLRWFHVTIAYDGTRYGGWQKQPNAITVQQKLEEALESIAGKRVKTVGSGRTDAGVHAFGQVASFSLEQWKPPAEKLIPSLNCLLPRDIVVRKCRDAKPGFHAIRDALSKVYRYSIWSSRVEDPLHSRMHWHVPKALDLEEMRIASRYLVGVHDFRAYQAHGGSAKSTIRHVMRLDIHEQRAEDGRLLMIDIESDGFLYNMVRKMVGTLIRVGTGQFRPERVRELLELGDRTLTGQTAPSRGLCLLEVKYPESCFDWPRPAPDSDGTLSPNPLS